MENYNQKCRRLLIFSDKMAEAEVLTRDLFGWKRKQLKQTASASSNSIDYTVLQECYIFFKQ